MSLSRYALSQRLRRLVPSTQQTRTESNRNQHAKVLARSQQPFLHLQVFPCIYALNDIDLDKNANVRFDVSFL